MRIAIIFICIAITTNLFSQDYLYMKDGSLLAVKDVETQKRTISFKLFHDPQQLPQNMLSVMIDSIVFEDGSVKRFDPLPRELNNDYFTDFELPKSNSIFVDLSLKNIGIGYEHKFAKKRLGLSFALSKGYDPKAIAYPDLYQIVNNNELGLKASLNIYLIDATYFSNGISVFFVNKRYSKYKEGKWWIPLEDRGIETAFYNGFGLGVYAIIQATPLLNFTGSIDIHIFRSPLHSYHNIFYYMIDIFIASPVPRLAIGITF